MITDRDRSQVRFCCLEFCSYRQGQRLHESLSREGLQQGLGEHGGAGDQGGLGEHGGVGGLGSRMGGGFLRFSSVDTLLSGATRFIRFLNCQTSSQPFQMLVELGMEEGKRKCHNAKQSAPWSTNLKTHKEAGRSRANGISFATMTLWSGSHQSMTSGGTSWFSRSP